MAQINNQKSSTTCTWCLKDPLYIKYHDLEWGVPTHDEHQLYECLTLESFQAGLSWWTILKKREHFRKAFDNFDPLKIAGYTDQKIASLLENQGIVRHKAKILATINNAQKYLQVLDNGTSFSEYIWSFTDGKSIDGKRVTLKDVPSRTEISDIIAKDLKQKGFKFLGSTTVYAYMQAIGMVNDHLTSCPRHAEIQNTIST